jgi:glutathionylspermidine synthase
VVVQVAVSVDKRLIPVAPPSTEWLRKQQLQWFTAGDNHDYLANRIVEVSGVEMRLFADSTRSLYDMMLDTARYAADRNLWEQVGVPQEAIELVRHSLKNELNLHLLGRFDFAGGLDGLPLRLLEFNADTCSLIPETAQIMPEMARPLGRHSVSNYQLMEHITSAFQRILKANPDREPTILFSGMGHEEDEMNLEVLRLAAKNAGFKVANQVALERVIFDADQGIFVETGPDRFQQYSFWFKMVPWEFICYEEPDLLTLLNDIILGGTAIVLNPAFTMLLQSKGLLALMAERYPDNPAILNASLDEASIKAKGAYVAKPMFGRTGDNLQMFDTSGEKIFENEGDYDDFPMVYQQMAELNEDTRGYLYQPSTFWAQQPSSLCFRRQDDPAIDDDAEFLGHVVG